MALQAVQEGFASLKDTLGTNTASLTAPLAGFETAALSADLIEKDDEFEIKAKVLNVRQEHVRVTINGDKVILGVKQAAGRQEGSESHRTEHGYSYHSYHSEESSAAYTEKSLQVPESGDLSKVTAHLYDGVLTVTIPKGGVSTSREP
jgi:HSP20 family molecular chaperone IbpA